MASETILILDEEDLQIVIEDAEEVDINVEDAEEVQVVVSDAGPKGIRATLGLIGVGPGIQAQIMLLLTGFIMTEKPGSVLLGLYQHPQD